MNETETPPITLITCDDWKTIPKEVSYKLYVDLYKLYLEKEKFIKDVITPISQQQLVVTKSNTAVDQGAVSSDEELGEHLKHQKGLWIEKVGTFPLCEFEEQEVNLLSGSSIRAKLQEDETIPIDIAVHGYRGSTTKEKIKIVEQYESKKLKTLILQDCTNSIVKFDKNCDEVMDDFLILVDRCREKFSPDHFVVCEVIPFKETYANTAKNALIDEFNSKLPDVMFKIDPSIAIVKCHQMIKSLPSTNPKIRHYNEIYHDNLHLKYKSGLPML